MTEIKQKQWTTAFDGLENLQFTTAAKPEPKDGEVLVKVLTVSLNYRDTEGEMTLLDRHWRTSLSHT